MKGVWCTAGKCKRHRKDFLAAEKGRKQGVVAGDLALWWRSMMERSAGASL